MHLNAVFLNHGQIKFDVITDAERVATLLAYHARLIADSIRATGNPQDLLRTLAESMRDGLGMHLDDEFFVPTVAQTLVYGLFAVWLESPSPRDFDYRDAPAGLHVRVIAELFHQILQPAFVRRCNLTDLLGAVARTLVTEDTANWP
ncbi:MAG: hypothetical protein IID38_04645 [Planctomycetes bacterium]|nr:hypothetical protein [Planctomycetota bacterium]